MLIPFLGRRPAKQAFALQNGSHHVLNHNASVGTYLRHPIRNNCHFAFRFVPFCVDGSFAMPGRGLLAPSRSFDSMRDR